MGVEAFAPCSAGVGKQDIDVVSVFTDFGHQPVDFGYFAAVGWDGDCDCAWLSIGEAVQRIASFLAGFAFAGRDEELCDAGLEEAGDGC